MREYKIGCLLHAACLEKQTSPEFQEDVQGRETLLYRSMLACLQFPIYHMTNYGVLQALSAVLASAHYDYGPLKLRCGIAISLLRQLARP
jgi:hypothetical protein